MFAAANLGDDTDTTAVVCGQIAGAGHDSSAIPESWFARLAMRDEIMALADALAGGARRAASQVRAGRRGSQHEVTR